jgi:hypothetical protein
VCVFKLACGTLTEPAVMAAERLMRAPGAVPDTTPSLHVHTGSIAGLPEFQRVNAHSVTARRQQLDVPAIDADGQVAGPASCVFRPNWSQTGHNKRLQLRD